jgi:site-specific DNA-methyltransferase (adenine-specific)
MSVRVLAGDCREVMAALPAESMAACVTDPPYGLEFMGREWDRGVPGAAFWLAVRRLLKPGAHLIAFGGTRTWHRLAAAIEDADFELRDTLVWLYSSGFPKGRNVARDIGQAAGAAAAAPWEGWSTGLKPAFEPIILARKPFKGPVAANVQRCGAGALNVAGCRVPVTEDTGSRHALGSATAGRWPPNLVHDGSAEVLEAFARFGELASDRMLPTYTTAGRKVYGQNVQGGYVTGETYGDAGTAARFFPALPLGELDVRFHYSGKAGRADRLGSRHLTIKPVALLRWLVRLVTPPGGAVLDPFAGSGTTAAAAILEGRDAVVVELEPAHVADIEARLVHIRGADTPLFAAPAAAPESAQSSLFKAVE